VYDPHSDEEAFCAGLASRLERLDEISSWTIEGAEGAGKPESLNPLECSGTTTATKRQSQAQG